MDLVCCMLGAVVLWLVKNPKWNVETTNKQKNWNTFSSALCHSLYSGLLFQRSVWSFIAHNINSLVVVTYDKSKSVHLDISEDLLQFVFWVAGQFDWASQCDTQAYITYKEDYTKRKKNYRCSLSTVCWIFNRIPIYPRLWEYFIKFIFLLLFKITKKFPHWNIPYKWTQWNMHSRSRLTVILAVVVWF